MDNRGDPFGIPANMFGPVPEEFYGAVGRVAMVAALTENKLAAALMQLEQADEGEHAGMSANELVNRLNRIATTIEVPHRLLDLRDEIVTTARERNAILHSLWPSPTMERAWGWRGVKPPARVGDSPIVEVTLDQDKVRTLIGRLVAVHDELQTLISSGELTQPPRS